MTRDRRRRFTARRLSAALVVLACMLLGAEAALAWDSRGNAFVQAVDPSRSTIVLSGDLYRVSSTAELVGTKGQPIRLIDLRPIPEGIVAVSTKEADIVRWEATKGTTGWVITSLTVLEDMPN